MNEVIIEVASAHISQWGEGPIWWNQCLYYVDIERHEVRCFSPASNTETAWNVKQRVGTIVPRSGGGFVCAGDHGFFLLDEKSGELTPIADPESEKANNRFNDGKCSPDGRFFAGTISLIKQTGDAALYVLDPQRQVSCVLENVTNSNGIIWSLDGTTMYYIDTPQQAISAFDYAAGKISNRREIISTKDIEGSPDGMTIDDSGNLWVAFCHGACVVNYDPIRKKLLRRIDLPCLETTACAFGGENLSDLYVTTGIHKTAVEEHAGKVLVIKNLGVKGVPSSSFAG